MKTIDAAVLRRALTEEWAVSIRDRGKPLPNAPEVQQSLDYAYGQVEAVRRIARAVGFSDGEIGSMRDAAVTMIVDRSAEGIDRVPAGAGDAGPGEEGRDRE